LPELCPVKTKGKTIQDSAVPRAKRGGTPSRLRGKRTVPGAVGGKGESSPLKRESGKRKNATLYKSAKYVLGWALKGEQKRVRWSAD